VGTARPSYGDEETAGDIEALIGELGVPAVIVGNSMAAGAAVIVAANHPELVNGLVLVGPFVREQAGNGFVMALFRIMTARPWAAAVWKAYMPTLYSGERPADFAAYREKVIASIKRPGYTSAFSKTTRLNHVLAGESLVNVEAPTLVVMGDKDPDFKNPRAEAEWIAHELHGTATMVADAGHYPQSQQPALTAAAILPFLASLKNHA
jgi:pimeloyl-ACP methyl ester carboxylesterase